jgi:calcineurin-like phosphoesterase
MSGPDDSVIGMDPESALLRFLTQIPVPYQPASSASTCRGVVVAADRESGKAVAIERFQIPHR